MNPFDNLRPVDFFTDDELGAISGVPISVFEAMTTEQLERIVAGENPFEDA